MLSTVTPAVSAVLREQCEISSSPRIGGELDSALCHFLSSSRSLSSGIASALPKREVTVVAWKSEL